MLGTDNEESIFHYVCLQVFPLPTCPIASECRRTPHQCGFTFHKCIHGSEERRGCSPHPSQPHLFPYFLYFSPNPPSCPRSETVSNHEYGKSFIFPMQMAQRPEEECQNSPAQHIRTSIQLYSSLCIFLEGR